MHVLWLHITVAKDLFLHRVKSFKQIFDYFRDLRLCVSLYFQHVVLQIAEFKKLLHNVYEVLVLDHMYHFCNTGMFDGADRIHLAFMEVDQGLRAIAQLQFIDLLGTVSYSCLFVLHLINLIYSAI